MPDNNYNPNNQRPYQGGQPQNMQGVYGSAPMQGAPGTQVTGAHPQATQRRPSAAGAGAAATAAGSVAGAAAGAGVAGGTAGSAGAATSGAGKASGAAGAGATATAKKLVKKRPAVIVGMVVIIVALVVALVALLMPKGDFYDSNSIIGQAPYKTTEEIQAELDRIVEEGMLNISIASVIEFENGESEGTAYIENVPGNHYVMQVDITLDDTGEKVYESGGIKPGSYIEKIKLSKDLDAGTYSATATFHALDPDSLQEVGSAAAIVTLNVLS